MNRPVITLLTDFGAADHYVGVMKGVILEICPDAQLVDLTHQIGSFDIEGAAYTLGQAYPFFPRGTTHLVVVDPGVGSARRPLLLEAGGHRFVAPDNGVLSVPMERNARFRARAINAEKYFRRPVSNTFHGRDIFAPVAAHLASGLAAGKLGRVVCNPVRLPALVPRQTGEGTWEGRVIRVDGFGNIVTNFDCESFRDIESRSFTMRLGEFTVGSVVGSYAAATDGPVAIGGSAGYYEISVNKGDASAILKVGRGAVVLLAIDGDQTPNSTSTNGNSKG